MLNQDLTSKLSRYEVSLQKQLSQTLPGPQQASGRAPRTCHGLARAGCHVESSAPRAQSIRQRVQPRGAKAGPDYVHRAGARSDRAALPFGLDDV